MADEADMAFEIASEHVARGLSTLAAAIPAGVAGECDECGEIMPRLVDGRCGFCRDGRRPPLSFFDAKRVPPAIAVASAPAAKETDVTTPQTEEKKVISVPVKGATLAAILAFSEAADLPLGQAVVAMIEEGEGLKASRATSNDVPTAGHDEDAADEAARLLKFITTSELLAEIGRRSTFDGNTVSASERDAAIRRAEAAEATLAALKGLLA